MTIRESFESQFGAEQADAVVSAAEYHLSSGATMQGDRGSDPFKWAVALAIGFECMSKQSYREFHGITADWGQIDHWIMQHADLGSHDGDVDLLAAFAGFYDKYVKTEGVRS